MMGTIRTDTKFFTDAMQTKFYTNPDTHGLILDLNPACFN